MSFRLSLTDHAPSPMAMVEGANHVMRYVNPAFCRLIDLPKEQLVGKSFGLMFPEQDEFVGLLDRVYRTGRPERHTEPEPSGPRPRFCSCAVWPVIENERPVGATIQVTEASPVHEKTVTLNEALVLGSVRQHELIEASEKLNAQLHLEITGRKRAEAEIRRLNAGLEQRVVERTAELQAVNEELQAFSYSVSHDLRAPLRHILGFVDLLQKDVGPTLSENNLRLLTTISDSAGRMGQLIDDLLAFSHIGQSEVRKTEIQLDELVREAMGDFEAESEKRNIVWEVRPLPAVRGDRALLRAALVNLMSNAVKFTGRRAQPKIEIGAAPNDGSEAVIYIRDNGAGFDPRYAHKLFGVFQRLHSPIEFEGTGIGLANVRRIIHRHGGRTWAEGEVAGGATFFFSIPWREVTNGGPAVHDNASS